MEFINGNTVIFDRSVKLLVLIIVLLFTGGRVQAASMKIVVLNSDGFEVIRALGAEDMVVGIGDVISAEPDFWGGYSKLPVAGGWRTPDYEMIVKLKPDAVLGYRRSPDDESEKKLAALGVKMFRYDFYRISNFEKEVQEFAALIGKNKEAEELLAWWKPLYSRIEKLSSAVSKPKVYIEGFGKYRSAGPGSGIHEMVTLAGGDNMAKGASIPYLEVNSEWVFGGSPDFIVKTVSLRDCYGGGCETYLRQAVDEFESRPGMKSLKAVRSKSILAMSPDIGPGPRGIIGTIEIAKRLHPDKFADIDPVKIHGDYLKKFHNLDYKGTYVYEPRKVTR